MKTIQVYASSVKTEVDGDQLLATLNNVEIDQLMAEFTTREVIEALVDTKDFSSVLDVVMAMKGENEE